ncbi:MAG: hypothetical protein EU529_07855 [Promethearchaeota archaeon]|nr:MAG: hypothetical protein EU529_07855 [Candidatus Lokiarchaeota archaeon]
MKGNRKVSSLTVTYERKIGVWKEIYKYLIKNKNPIKNYQLNHKENELFDYLKRKVYSFLENNTDLLNDLRISERTVIPREIIYIYLLICENTPYKTELIRKAGVKKCQDEYIRINKMIEILDLGKVKGYYEDNYELVNELRQLLDRKKQQIINGEFIPDTKNLINYNNEFRKISDITSIISQWLREHTKFKSLKNYKGYFTPTYKLRNLLKFHKKNILEGKFYPTIINLRKIDKDYDKITDPHTIINNWLMKASNNKFKNMRQLIEFFVPPPSLLGYVETKLKHEEYTLKFESVKYRIKKVFFQTIKIIDNKNLIQIKSKDIRGWRTFFRYLDSYKDFNFVDLLTGEIFTSLDYSNARINFHHIDGNKQNDNDDNLCFLLKGNHAMITGAERYNTELKGFFIKILKANLNSIKERKIPLSWKIDWRELVKKLGIYIPKKYYKRRSSKKTILNNQSQDNSLNSFLDL